MDISYFQKINNTYKSHSKQETDLYLLNRHVDECFTDTIDYHVVKRNGEPFELLIIKDTDGNTFKKKIKSKNSTPFNLGDYIEWNNQIWLVTLLDPDDKTYHSGYMYLCTVPLRWQNSEGKIIERYAYSEDFTKYSNGTTGNNTITIGDNQYGLTLPIDSETRKLTRDMRFPIDFEDAEKPDIYKLTNRKVNLNNNEYFGRGGTMILTMSYDAFNADEDKRVAMDNGKEVWICNYRDISNPVTSTPHQPPDTDETAVLYHISCKGNPTLVAGGNYKKFYVVNNDGDVVTSNVTWNIITTPEQEKYISYQLLDSDNSIKIKSMFGEHMIGSAIKLTASVNGIEISINIEIGGGM